MKDKFCWIVMVPSELDWAEDIKRMKIKLSLDEVVNLLIEAEKSKTDRK